MAIVKELNQHYIDTQLVCPPGKSQTEVVVPGKTGLYIEVRATSPVGTYYLRFKQGKTICRIRIGRTNELKLDEARAAAIHLKAASLSEAALPLTGVPAESEPVQQVTAPRDLNFNRSMTLDSFMTDHYFPRAKMHKRSWKRDESLWRLRIKRRFGHLALSAINRREVQRFHLDLVAEGLSNASANHHVQLMRHVLNEAVNDELLDRNVLKGIPLLALDNQVDEFLDEVQVAKLAEVLKTDGNRLVCMILLFLLSTGARLGEALRAKWSQVDLDAAVWKIPVAHAKGKRALHLPLNKSALETLGQLDSKDKSDLLFPSPATGKPFTTITRQWYRIRKKAGIPDNFRIHDLRHAYASRLVAGGQNLYEVQKLLGHADPRTTMRYAHMDMRTMQAASNAGSLW